nr:filamentous hemagglutinin N-terminal domain-containing protein [Pseudomonas sp. Pc102]
MLNEVTGTNPSQLKGYTEVAGQGAHVIVANPHGITCDGCGFINTPRATLSTGAPMVENGALKRYDVDGGQIRIEGQGLNASNVDQFELITRSAQINAALHARQLAMVTGRNDVDATTLAATAKADDGTDKPQLAIDSSALGGMYAGAIRLVGTEQGVGVKLAGDMAASGGDIQIDANGKLTLSQAAASRDIALKAQSIELGNKTYAGRNVKAEAAQSLTLEKDRSLAAGAQIDLKAEQLGNQGVIEAGVNRDNSRNTTGDVKLSGGSLRNQGTVVASRDLEAALTGTLDNRAGAISGKANTRVAARALDNRDDGLLLSKGSVTVDAESLDNRKGAIAADQSLNVKVAQRLDNQDGELSSRAVTTIDAGQLDNRGGQISADRTLTVSADALDNSAKGTLSSRGSLVVQKAALNNQGGTVVADQRLDITGQRLDNRGEWSAARAMRALR